MDAKSEHFRFYVFVESKRGQSPQQILQQLRVVFGESAPGSTFVYKWFSEFRSGNRDSAQHLHHPGRPVLQRTDANISRVYDLITEQPKSTLVYLSGELLLSKETVRRILVDDLLFRKVCSTWVPHSLTEENKDHSKRAFRERALELKGALSAGSIMSRRLCHKVISHGLLFLIKIIMYSPRGINWLLQFRS